MKLDTELRSFLHRRARDFLGQLTAIEVQNDKALQAQSHEDQRLRYEPKKVFNGYGMCQLASAALAEGIAHHFGDEVSVYGIVRSVPNLGFSHQIIRVSDRRQELTVESTHRQIRAARKAAILAFPSQNETRLYRGGDVCDIQTVGELLHKEREYVSAGVYAGIRMRDFNALVETLKG